MADRAWQVRSFYMRPSVCSGKLPYFGAMGFSAVGGFEGIEVYFVGKSDPDQYLLTKQFSEMKLL
ncbi:hypothetical protein, partial [Thiolapillus sp.]|uniref:hypothetical protein n=1 Tax=Thiolapillus sp. TaxID=2017437 RepID=UPI003AF8833A